MRIGSAPSAAFCSTEFAWKRADDLHGLDADADDLADEADDALFVLRVVGVAGNGDAFIGFNLVLVDYPVEGTAVAEAVVERLGRDAGEGERIIDAELRFVFGEAHLFDAVRERDACGFDPLQRPGLKLLAMPIASWCYSLAVDSWYAP